MIIDRLRMDHTESLQRTKQWTYKALETLSTDWDAIETMEYNEVFLIPYAINEGGPVPFLEFGLKKRILQEKEKEKDDNSKRDTLGFVSLFGKNYEEILSWGKTQMNFLLDGKISFENVTVRERLFSGTEEYEFKGFLLFEEHLYVWVDVSRWKKNDIMCMDKNSPLWFVLVDEIKNSKHTCLLQWYHEVEHFFFANPDFLWLHDAQKDEVIESPEVVYIPSPGNKLKFVAIFGPQSEEASFRDYYEAFKEGNKRYQQEEGWWGLVRFASFSESETEKRLVEGLSFHYIDKRSAKEESYHYIM